MYPVCGGFFLLHAVKWYLLVPMATPGNLVTQIKTVTTRCNFLNEFKVWISFFCLSVCAFVPSAVVSVNWLVVSGE